MFDGFSKMTSFLAELVNTDKGVTCHDSGFIDLSTAQECSGAVSYARTFNSKAIYKSETSSNILPKGCFINNDGGEMFFNTHTGGSWPFSSSICRKGNT